MNSVEVTSRVKERYHPINGLGVYALIDKLTGSVYQIDKAIYASLAFKKNNINQELISELNEILSEPNFQKDFHEAAGKLEGRTFYPRALCLNISGACNMRCRYCFTHENTHFHDNVLMSQDTAKLAVDFLFNTAYPSFEIDFFGGEPLLNWDVVKNAVIYAKQKFNSKNKTLKLSLTTNGLMLDDEIIEFLNKHNVSLTLSLDGPPEVNDKMRKLTDGGGSFYKAVENFKKLLERRNYSDYYLRGTYTSRTLNFFNSLKFLMDSGFENLSLEPVVGKGFDFSISLKDLKFVEKEYRKLAEFYYDRKNNGNGFNFYHFNLNLYNPPCLEKRLLSCAAGMEYLAVSPDGGIYPCHQFVGKKDFCLGDIKNGIINESLQQSFRKANVLNQDKCAGCWAKFYCSGGCYASNFNATGNILTPDRVACELMKIRVKYALLLEVKIREA